MRSLLLVVVVCLSGCVKYIPHPPDSPPIEGREFRARLTNESAVRLSGTFGEPIQSFEGRLVGNLGDSLTFALLSAQEYKLPWTEPQNLTLAATEIVALEERRIDGRRTALLVAGTGTVAGVLIVALFRAASGTGDEDGGGQDLALIPIFSIIH